MAHYGYVRVSTATQAEKGYGLDTQLEAIEKWSRDNGITIEKVYRDEGVSGAARDNASTEEAIGKRHGLLELLNVLQEGDSVVVLNTSRLWRSKATSFLIPRELINRKANVISIQQPEYSLYNDDPNNRFIEVMLEAMDALERGNIALKLAKGRAAKAAQGDKPAGAVPYGYSYTRDRKHVEVEETEAKWVKYMFSQAQAGRTLSEITDALNAKGVKTKRGNAWTRGSVRAILHNDFYTGMLTHQGVTEKGNHQAIISRIQFGKVAAALDRRHK